MSKDVLIVAHFCSDFDNKGNNRFNYIAELLYQNGYDVELATSDFSHFKKQKREKIDSKYAYKITLIEEPGYKKNVSLERFRSHNIMGRNLKKYLEARKKPDMIYCAVPSLDAAAAAAEYARKNGIKFIIDVQDLWPEAFKVISRVPLAVDLLFYPMKRKANRIYSTADEIIAVSKTYAKRALSVNTKCREAHDIFLGTDLAFFDRLSKENKFENKPANEIWLAYIGTLGHNYDLNCVVDALDKLRLKGIKNIKFIVMGDGPLKDKFENYAKTKGIYSEFTGRLEYGKMVGILTACDIAVNPISHGSAISIINKVGDYAAAGLPVLNTQECQEYRDLIEEYSAGFNCDNNNADSLADKLLVLYEDSGLREIMGLNNRKLAKEKFDRSVTYQNIVRLLSSYVNVGTGKA